MINRKMLILGLIGGLLLGPTFPEHTNIIPRIKFKIRYKQVHKQIKNSKLFYDCFLFSGTARANENQTFSDSVKIFSGHVEDLDGIKPRSGVVMVRDVQSDSTYSSYLDTLARFYIEIVKTHTGVKGVTVSIPSGYALSPFYPNPNDGRSSLSFNWSLADASDVNVSIYNILSQRVKEIASGNLRAGNYRGFWDGTNEAGLKVAEGVYFVNLRGSTSKGKGLNLTKKCLLLDQISGSGTGYAFGDNGFTYDPRTGLFKANSGSDYELMAEIPGRFVLSKNYSKADNTEGLSLVTDRKASFTSGFSDTLYVVEGGTVYKIAIPAVDNDDSDHSFAVNGQYASIVGDSILISPPKDANALSVLELIAKENGVKVDSVSTNVQFLMGNYAPVITVDFPTDTLYVMQGVTDLDSIAAIPLRDGIHDRYVQLDFATDLNGDSLIWTAQSSDTSKINAFVQDGVLYVAGKDTTGYGNVLVRVSDPSGEFDERNLAVLVFNGDRTYEEGGKTNYYVPWNSVLDVNRINSVEEHMDKYNKPDLGLLDRSINFSRWRLLEKIKSVHNGETWLNDVIIPQWSKEVQYRTVDYIQNEIKSMGANYIAFYIPFYMDSLISNDINPKYDFSLPTWTDEDVKYVVSEWFRKGGEGVIAGVATRVLKDGSLYGSGRQEMRPQDWDTWVDNYKQLSVDKAGLFKELGVPIIFTGVELFNLSEELTGMPYVGDNRWNESMVGVVNHLRNYHPGAFTWAPVVLPSILKDDNAYSRIKPVLSRQDILGYNIHFDKLTNVENPSLEDAVRGWDDILSRIINPFSKSLNKPYIVTEAGGMSRDGIINNLNSLSSNSPIDIGEHRILIQSIIQSFYNQPRNRGILFWEISYMGGQGGYNDGNSTFRLKPAQYDISSLYDGSLNDQIVIDGDMTEWNSELILVNDSIDDHIFKNMPDVKFISETQINNTLYILIKFDNFVDLNNLA